MGKPLARITCPICDTIERMELTGPLRVWSDVSRQAIRIDPNCHVGAAAAICPNCQSPFGVLIYLGSSTIQHLFNTNSPEETDVALRDASIVTVPPSAIAPESYPNLPKLISENFVYIQEDAQRRRNPAGILSGARSCLDVALKALGQEEGGRRARINNLASAGLITTAIAAWAQTLWEEGSDASHDLQANLDRAIEHVDFLRLFFEVAFEMPARVALSSHGAVPVEPVAD
ncbi:DUF4145 domain-containing protein [Phenylobacterium sp.]|uniref:DUF4145 domain-containing protein n=1 Tax=Phenylobacterium sp. TaxID=1871053 RepID=UPI0027336E1A|nr:DUF4145 domain-containing protein [Phenylobacterium sp.]MDP3853130.1 hypothetical protein [Phenylobacterium sp.]